MIRRGEGATKQPSVLEAHLWELCFRATTKACSMVPLFSFNASAPAKDEKIPRL
jgi:hypothetical protein